MLLDLLKTPLGRLRLVGFLEGLSFLVLLGIAMPLKYLAGEPAAVRLVGMAHGLLFVLYVLLLIQNALELRWSFGKTLLGFVASLLPFGTFYADKKLFQPAVVNS
jgi:integral membrane protein